MLYEDERRLAAAFFKGLLGDQGFEEFNQETAKLTHEEQNKMLAEWVTEENSEDFVGSLELPETEEEWLAAEKIVAALPAEERVVLPQQGTLVWAGIFGTLFNTLSLIVHDVKLTTLVPLAFNGPDDALLKAAQQASLPAAISGKRTTAADISGHCDLILAAHAHAFITSEARTKTRLGALGYHPSLVP